ncbi:long-chain-fatty-acid--CoA ligase [Clostridia bacterium]|nr:long-chain-fatty-acid--CoA ligase [Clostridia bacterium]
MRNELKAPWYKYYKGVREHLDYPDISIYGALELAAEKYPENTALNYFGSLFSYKKLIEDIEKCARAFKQSGIGIGDVVTVCMPNTPEAIIVFYALNKIGAVSSMTHPLSAENELKNYLLMSESKMLVIVDFAVEKALRIIKETKVKEVISVSVGVSMPFVVGAGYYLSNVGKIKSTHKAVSWGKFIKRGRGGETDARLTGKEKAVILYSGGTTGIPKGIVLTNLNVNAVAAQGVEACACLKIPYSVLAIMPIFHGFGLGICIHSFLYFGMTCIVLPRFKVPEFHKLLTKYKPSLIAGVPTLYEALLKNENMKDVDLSFLKAAISGGDSLSAGLKNKVDKFLREQGADVSVREGYGLTECVTGSCLMPLGEYRENSIGVPYPDMYYKIVREGTCDTLPYGDRGEIVISGPTLMLEYLNNPKETADTLKTHEDGVTWLHTGDLGYMDEDGFVYFVGRIKRMIKSSGYDVHPQQIENVLDAHPRILVSAVVGVKHKYKKQVPKAFVVLKDNAAPTDEIRNEITEHCAKNLSKYSMPYEIEFRNVLPTTPVGKTDYRRLMAKEGDDDE